MPRMTTTTHKPGKLILAENLARILDERGRGSRAQLASELNWPASRISDVLNSRCNPDLRTVDCLADALGLTIAELLAQ